ncbi:MAG: hypothetical protein V1899_02495 [Planctomycetota bacterium]
MMATDHHSLQDLIVRALTGMDQRARQSLEVATAKDPELKQFYAELNEVVNLLSGSKDWRAETPSAELTAKIRSAVSQKLQSAPPHFRTVLLNADLGRRRALLSVIIWVVAVVALLSTLITWLWGRCPGAEAQLRLSGNVTFDETFKNPELPDWKQLGLTVWQTSAKGLRAEDEDGEEPVALYLKKGFEATAPLALEVDVSVPGLDEQSTVLIFLAEAGGMLRSAFDDRLRPVQALTLEISRNSLVLLGPEQQLLHSSPSSNTAARFYRLRMEHLGARVRMLMNGKVSFDGRLERPLRGTLYPGVRVTGLLKNKIYFNRIRFER